MTARSPRFRARSSNSRMAVLLPVPVVPISLKCLFSSTLGTGIPARVSWPASVRRARRRGESQLIEQHPQFGAAAGKVIEALEKGRFRGIASELNLLELTVRPLQLGRQDAADDYETLLSYFPNLELVPISRQILLEAAGLRARHRLRTPDAIQLATGL